jgi:Flp pilus assembly protein CpaB
MELTGKNYTRNDWRKLLATRRGTVLVAAACALIAGGILVVAMNRYRSNVDSSGNQETVLVASGLIQKGTSGDAIASEKLFKPTSIAAKQVSTGAIADTAQLQGRVAAADINPGQQLTVSDFTANGGLLSQLGPNQRAITITVDSSRGMVGQINEGDHVDVYADLELANSRNGNFVRLLLPDTPVLKAPTSASGGGLGGGANPQSQQSNVTLKVSADQAGELAYAADNGKVWLVLRPANAGSAATPSISAQSLLSSGSAVTGGKK